jgi:signal transduction histidine kinase/DNA-binding response OmpR family regulator
MMVSYARVSSQMSQPLQDPGLLPDPIFAGAGEMAALMRAKDWSKTPLGHPASWPQSLRTVVRILLTSRYSMWMGWGPELCFLYNDAYKPTLGEKHRWALGAPAREVWAEIWGAIGPRIETVLHSGESTWDEGLLLFLERNGYPEETYHTFSYSPLSDDGGAIRGHLCVVTEETERLLGERRLALLRALAARLSASAETNVLRAIEDSLAGEARDIPFSLTYFFEEGGTRARLVSTTRIAADHPRAPAFLEVSSGAWRLDTVWATGAPIAIELPGDGAWPTGPWRTPPTRALVVPIAQQGQPRPAGAFVAALNPHRPLDGDYRAFLELFVGQVGAGLANARAYQEERRRAEALAELDRAKTTFFSNVSHEFRTPLTLMLGPLAELMRDEDLDAGHREELALVQRNGLRLLRLVNTLLDFSRIEAGRARAQYEPVNLSEYTADLASVFRAATDKAGLVLRVDCADLGGLAIVDRDMWEKIVLNLISNAFKFTLEGQIAVVLSREEDDAVLTVSDTGCGIPAAELPHIFDRFHRVEGTPGRTHEGTGIGLALVKELVALQGGRVSVTSRVGHGTVFTVRIPLGRPPGTAEQNENTARATAQARHAGAFLEEALRWLPDSSIAGPPARTSPPTPSATPDQAVPLVERGRILLADDNADMREYIRRLLGDRWDVETVGDGRQALHAIERRPPDVLITDVMMPEMDGFALVRALRASEATRDLPVIVLSARAGEEARVEGLQAGVNDYLVKPFSARELVARVDSLLLRHRIRSAEEAQSRRMARVFAQAPVGVAILRGPTHVFESANPAYLELVGNRPVVGKPMREALPELEGQGLYELLDRVYASGEAHVGRSLRVEISRRVANRPEECFFDFVYQPMFAPDGNVDGIAVVVFDVTELAKARHASEIANRAKDEFLAMLGHELRNPLAPILTALQLMRLRGSDAVEREREVIERQVHHMVGLVDDLLDVSRITQGKVQLKREPVEMADLVASAVEMASPLLESQRHELKLDLPKRGLTVDGDAARLAQVISNLLTNAAKYTPPGGQIAVEGRAEGQDVVLQVRDTGIGIERDMLPHIFEPFTQERQALDRAQGGLGLGLAIVRSLVQMHGGSVAVRSEGRGRGSEFEIRIPRLVRSAKREADAGRDPQALPVHSNAPRVLVVDDNEDAASMLAEMLQLYGFDTRFAHDGPSALTTALEFRPQVAILDIGLPVMDGYELARRFGEHAELRDTRLVVLTGYGQDGDRARSALAGFRAHLVKPVDPEQLRGVLDELTR